MDRIERYTRARRQGATALAAWLGSYDELIAKGLVETWQDGSPTIMPYPVAIRRRLPVGSFAVANQLYRFPRKLNA